MQTDVVEKVPSQTPKNQLDGSSNDWFIVSESVIGKTHVTNSTLCQDNHFNKILSNGWGIAVICDGAGSAENSHIGSAFVAKEAIPRYFEELIANRDWTNASSLPTQAEWEIEAKKVLVSANGALRILADDQKITFSSLACTVIVALYSPLGILVTHIGDGRAGYCNELGEWSSILKPHKGEEANQTIFITSGGWASDEHFMMSGVSVPESRVIEGKPTCFALLSDGCEYHSFQCSMMDSDGQWTDPNQPYPKFFNPIVETLRKIAISKGPSVDIQDSWKNFLEAGTDGLKNEPDDKTMIIGIAV